MEGKVGEVYEVAPLVKLKVVESYGIFSCAGCWFLDSESNMCGFQKCRDFERKDRKSVKFVKIYDI